MAIFQVNGNKAIKLDASTFEKEKTLQNLFEGNLDDLLDMEFVHTEYPTSFAGRIDTLAIDADGAPVIIEYKKTQNDNVINQGLSYLRWLLDHKADFEKLCAQKGIKAKVSWEVPRVICIAEAFNRFDLDTVAMSTFSLRTSPGLIGFPGASIDQLEAQKWHVSDTPKNRLSAS